VIGIDTNVLVRFLVGDDPEQEARAARLIEEAASRDERLFVSQLVVCELVWVLGYAYDQPRGAIASGLTELLRARQLTFEDSEQIRSALDRYATGAGDLADWLIWERSKAAGCKSVVTFDARLLRSDSFGEV
jgi:predicted nucleic-acid-binding protein